MLDVQSLRVFTAVADKLSLTRAGEALMLSQSAVSHQVAKLEREMQVELLTRQGRSVALTPAGRELQRQASELIQRIDALPAAVRAAADVHQGTLRIGATATACQYLLPDPLREIRECFPRFALSVMPADSPVVIEWVASGTVDIGIVIRSEKMPKLPQRPLFTDQLGLVFHPLHSLAKAGKLTAADLANLRWVMYNRGSATFRMVERHLTRLRVAMNGPMELGSIEAIKELVKLGLGVTVLARWVVEPELATGALAWRPLPGPKLIREWTAILNPHREVNLAEETLIELCRSAARELIPDQAKA
jgi:DNA-binding transcriptional LysR family regulator